MVGVQCVLWHWAAAEAAPVQAELRAALYHGSPSALRKPNATRGHTELPAPPLLPLGGQHRLEHSKSAPSVEVEMKGHELGL